MIHLVFMLRRLFTAGLALAIAGALAPAAEAHHSDFRRATTGPAVGVTDSAATLTGTLSGGGATAYWFEYGSARERRTTDPQPVDAGGDTPVSAAVTGLKAGTIYRFRLVTRTSAGDAQRFTTAVPTPVAPPPVPATPPPVAPAQLPSAELGKSVVVAPVSGSVKVRAPGQPGFTQLTGGGSVPVGALVDTRGGGVRLTSALGDGRTQDGVFHGGLFQVRQSAKGKGLTDLVLRGGDFGACPRHAGARARAAAERRRKRPLRRLWGSDRGGRFRTHGRNSVATVRGTRWVTTDTCAGTRTTVTEGAVAVRDVRRKRTVVVRKGHSYLARSR
jgi:hypothetical protein